MPTTRSFASAADPAWTPGRDVRARSRLLRAMRSWGLADLDELHQRSVLDPSWFWRAVVEDLDVAFGRPFDAVLDESAGKALPRWFVGGTLNAAELCAHRHARGPHADKTAIVYEGDAGQCRALSYRQLDVAVRRFAANLALA